MKDRIQGSNPCLSAKFAEGKFDPEQTQNLMNKKILCEAKDIANHMTYLPFARKWRPQDFDEIVGQEHITTILKNAISLNRVHHAYLFTGPRGIGKT